MREWKTSENQYRSCYIGNLSNDFLRIQPQFKSQINQEKDTRTTAQSSTVLMLFNDLC